MSTNDFQYLDDDADRRAATASGERYPHWR